LPLYTYAAIPPTTSSTVAHDRCPSVALDSNTVAMLRRWRAQQNEEKLLVGPGYVNEGYAFSKPDGTVYDPDRFSREFVR
jgi:hypothetical protein